VELALSQARYEAGLARRQYDAVDPDNRLVAAELERRWNDRLVEVHCLEEQLAALEAAKVAVPTAEERARLMALGADIEALWHHPGATAETRKHILRTAIVEIVAKIVGNTIDLVVHWQGGDHTRLTVPKNRRGHHRWTTDADTSELIQALARQQPDAGIAAILNRCGKRTGKGNTWTESRVRSHRTAHGIAVYRDGEMAERGELTLEETARHLKVSKMTVLRLIGNCVIQARQVCKGAPWAIPETELAGLDPRTALIRRPQSDNPDQQSFVFQ
jgi:hypothetical protein